MLPVAAAVVAAVPVGMLMPLLAALVVRLADGPLVPVWVPLS
jgi:hypothetical protein